MSVTSIACDNLIEADSLIKLNPRARYMGGGTLVMRDLNQGDQSFDTIVRVNDNAMSTVSVVGDRILIGASVTMAVLLKNNDCSFLAPVASSVGGPAIRNMATVGGNLFAASPYGDLTTALLVLDGELTLANGTVVTLEEFLQKRDDYRSSLVVKVSIAKPNRPGDFRYLKVSRVKPKGISVMSIAAYLPSKGARLFNVKVAFGAMGPTPLRSQAVEQALEGKTLSPEVIDAAAKVSAQGLAPVDDAIASSWYRNEMAPVHLKRLLHKSTTTGY